jgi:hypothetical protein
MPILVKVVGIIIIAVAIILIVRTEVLEKFIKYILDEDKMIYFGGVIRLIIGAFLLLAASQCKIPLLILVLGIIILASGILVFLLGTDRVKKALGWILERPPIIKRLIPVIALLFGALLAYGG